MGKTHRSMIVAPLASTSACYEESWTSLCREKIFGVLEKPLLRRGIPYHVVKGTSLLEEVAIQAALAYVRLVLNPRDDIAFELVINKPARRIGKPQLLFKIFAMLIL